MHPYQTILLIGPTGSGKTPFGNLCEEKGLWERKCVHFDFGENLRAIAVNNSPHSFLSANDMQIIHHSLQTGALLENEHFHIALKILASFTKYYGVSLNDLLILNGLPRHIGQATDIDAIVDIAMVIHLECPAETVQQRIILNSGGDRNGRVDDSLEEIKTKLAHFHDRTVPLLSHYHSKAVQIERVPITIEIQPKEIHRKLEENYHI